VSQTTTRATGSFVSSGGWNREARKCR